MARRNVVIDFETKRIQNRPDYPPVPVGVSIKEFGKKAHYFAWGHPTNNNCTKQKVIPILRDYFRNWNCLFHHAAFDIAVAIKKLKLPFPQSFDCTMIMAFLYDPHNKTLSLKPISEQWLGMPAKESVRMEKWIMANTACKGTRADPWGAWISETPGDLCASYANGDTIRPEKLYKFLMPQLKDMGLIEAYIREKKCLPIFEQMSDTGLNLNTKRLKREIKPYEEERGKLEKYIRRKLKTKELDIKSDKQLATVLDEQNKIDEWFYTPPSKTYPNGQKSTKRENLMLGCNDKRLATAIGRYGELCTWLDTFLYNWLEAGEKHGRLHPTFNQVRSADERGKSAGTRTGRPSSSNPNLLNVPKELRQFICPDAGCSFNDRDYSQQEIRILFHMANSESMLLKYNNDPHLNAHHTAREIIYDTTSIKLEHLKVKTIAFGIIYGMGVTGLSKKLNITKQEAKQLKDAYLNAFPEIRELQKELKLMASNDEPLSTWGGRLYWCEEPAIVDGQRRTFEYKLLNYLIQGSAADITKQAMINVSENCDHSRITLQIYDQLLCNVPKKYRVSEMKKQREAMEDIKLTIPLITDGSYSHKSWGEKTKCL